MVHKKSPRTAVGTIGEYVEKKQAEIAKNEQEKAKAEEKSKEAQEETEGKTDKGEQVKEEAADLAVAAIIEIVREAIQNPKKKSESSDEAKIEVERIDSQPLDEQRKADNLLVEVDGVL